MKYLPLILGLACIIGAGYQLYRNTRLLISGRAAEGVVIRNEKSLGKNTVYYPIVQFQAADGQSYACKGQSGTYPAQYEASESVSVHYDPAQPANAFIGSFFGVIQDAFLSMALGTVFVWFGLRIVRRKPLETISDPLSRPA
ncbi:MAG: DUF3592 domain-containing protein [Bacteroidetes bacterium]|nr:DUF3592 domain-containing protein [Fibrella sp.]